VELKARQLKDNINVMIISVDLPGRGRARLGGGRRSVGAGLRFW